VKRRRPLCSCGDPSSSDIGECEQSHEDRRISGAINGPLAASDIEGGVRTECDAQHHVLVGIRPHRIAPILRRLATCRNKLIHCPLGVTTSGFAPGANDGADALARYGKQTCNVFELHSFLL
jgi:hypothetical protein